MKRLNINLYEGAAKEKYAKKRAEYIADYRTYVPGGLLTYGEYQNNPVLGEAEWNKRYPEGYDDWANQQYTLTSKGQQNVIDKVNELVDSYNKKNKKTK